MTGTDGLTEFDSLQKKEKKICEHAALQMSSSIVFKVQQNSNSCCCSDQR